MNNKQYDMAVFWQEGVGIRTSTQAEFDEVLELMDQDRGCGGLIRDFYSEYGDDTYIIPSKCMYGKCSLIEVNEDISKLYKLADLELPTDEPAKSEPSRNHIHHISVPIITDESITVKNQVKQITEELNEVKAALYDNHDEDALLELGDVLCATAKAMMILGKKLGKDEDTIFFSTLKDVEAKNNRRGYFKPTN